VKAQVDAAGAKAASPASSAPNDERYSLKTKVGYGVGNVAVMVGKQAPKQLSCRSTTWRWGEPGAGRTVLALGRLVDASPILSWATLSDKLASRWGRRKPFIFVGTILAGLFFTGLWLCPRGLTPTGCHHLFHWRLAACITWR